MFRTNVFCVCLGSWRCWYFVEHPSSGRKQRWRHLRCSHCSWQLASRHCRFVQSRFEMAFSRWIKVRAKIPELLCIPVYFLKYPVQFQINPVHAAAVYPSCFVRTAYTLHVDSTRSTANTSLRKPEVPIRHLLRYLGTWVNRGHLPFLLNA